MTTTGHDSNTPTERKFPLLHNDYLGDILCPGSSSAAHLPTYAIDIATMRAHHIAIIDQHPSSSSVITIDWLPRMLASALLLFGSCSGISSGPSLSSLMAHGWNTATYGYRLLLNNQLHGHLPTHHPDHLLSVWELSRLNLYCLVWCRPVMFLNWAGNGSSFIVNFINAAHQLKYKSPQHDNQHRLIFTDIIRGLWCRFRPRLSPPPTCSAALISMDYLPYLRLGWGALNLIMLMWKSIK